MWELHQPSVFIILGILYLLLPAVTWVLLKDLHNLPVALWCLGGMVYGFGLISLATAAISPAWVYVGISNGLYVIAQVMRIQSLRLEMGDPLPRRWIWLLLAIAVSFPLITLDESPDMKIWQRTVLNSVSVVLLIYLAQLVWMIYRREGSRSARWIAYVYTFVALALLNVMIFRFIDGSSLGRPSEVFTIHGVLLSVSLLLSSVIGHFGYVGLMLDRALRREINVAATAARDEESRRLGEQIARLDRQRSLGEMSASLGHELNQPLASILTNVQVVKRGVTSGRFDTEQIVEFLDKIAHNTKRASQIIDRIRGFIRPTPLINEPVDLNVLVRDVTELIQDHARSQRVRIVLRLGASHEGSAALSPIWVRGDAIQLSQVVLNVLRNAVEALTHADLREIELETISDGARAHVLIRDTGPGFDDKALAKAGEPFFTTKLSGLGMGLSISRSIAHQHGGTLTMANGSGAAHPGATVELNLPLMNPAHK